MKVTDKYVFFWGGIYSQWYKANMEIDGVTYNCCEQFMMHQKALLFKDYEIAKQILAEKNPKTQKELGRKVEGFDKGLWDKVCFSIVYKGNLAKFTQHEDLKQELIQTGNRVLVEASPFDTVWGVGLGEETPQVDSPSTWRGTNLLGFALTTVRGEISEIDLSKLD